MEDPRSFNRNKGKIILVDSDVFIAWVKVDDSNHSRATQLYSELAKQPVTFYTSNYVFAESVTVISQRVGHAASLEFISSVHYPESPIQKVWIDEAIEERAIEIFRRQTSKNVSFVDCTNMALVDHYKFDHIFSFDVAYRKNGYNML